MIFSRDDIVAALDLVDDLEELCADLIETASMVTHTGDVTELEVLLEELGEFIESSSWGDRKVWKDFFSLSDEEESE